MVARLNPVSKPPHDYQLVVFVNNQTKECCICGYSAATKRFLNLEDLQKREFIATHWAPYPELESNDLFSQENKNND